jgi:threonine dehydrogenase-like Zn-dependent dehydrogenase
VVDRYSDVRGSVATILHEKGAPAPRVIFDAVSQDDTLGAALDILAPGGQIATILPIVDKEKYKDTGKHVFGILRSEYLARHRDEAVQIFSKLSEWFESGALKVGPICSMHEIILLTLAHVQPNRVEVLPDGLKGIVDGLKRWEGKSVSGVKLIGRPQE